MSSRQLVTVDVAVPTAALAGGDVANDAVIVFPINGYGVGRVVSLTIIDTDHNSAANTAGVLWLYRASVTPATSNTAHSVSDVDAKNCIGHISVVSTDALLSALNTVAHVRLVQPLLFEVTGGALYGIWVCAVGPTYASGSLRFQLGIA